VQVPNPATASLKGEFMTNEDKQLIGEYMRWTYHVTDDGKWWNCIGPKGGNHLLDLNDAGLVVQEMQKRGEWLSFITFADNEHFDKEISVEFSAWFFNSDNFFKTFVEWRKGK
jgi:hypothetical protein